MINLNALKRGSDNNYHKLEIPVALGKVAMREENNISSQFCGLRVDSLAFNSNCQLEFSYAFGKT